MPALGDDRTALEEGRSGMDGPQRTIVSTLDYPRRSEWQARVETVPPLGRVATVRHLVAAAASADVIILDGSIGIRAGNPDLIAAALIARRRRPRVILAEANWKPGSGLDQLVRKMGMKLIDRAVSVFCVVSKHEHDVFPGTWGLDRDRVAYTPFYYTLSEEELAAPVTGGGGVFAGGNPMRDYGTLVEAVRGLDVPVRIATSRKEVVERDDLPANVVAGLVPHDEYVTRLRGADVVAVPLQARTLRSGGEQTYLNAMALGKPVVVSDSPGASDYIEAGVTRILVPPSDPVAMRAAIEWVLDPANADRVSAMGQAAREAVRARFSPQAWVGELLRLADG